MTQQEINLIITDYKNNISINELIKKYHHKYNTIKNILLENNIKIRSKSEAISNKNKKNIPFDIEQKIIENYKKGFGLIASGKPFNIGQYKVKEILKKYNINTRTQVESVKVKINSIKKYDYDEDYFKNVNKNSAYILGFLAADGSVGLKSNRIKITLVNKDAELLEKIKKELKYTGEIKYTTTNNGFDIATLEIHSSIYKQDLAKYNIIPNKTFTFTIPDTIPKQYWIDFIRGYWDGDGTICTAGKSIRSSLCSVKKEFLEQVLIFLEQEYNIPKVTIYNRIEKNTLYYFQYSNTSTKKLFKALYYEDNLLFLNRKYKKFCELCIDK